MKYTKEVLAPLVKASLSIAEVMRKLGLKHLDGGTHSHITRRIREFGIDTSHFLGRSRNRGATHKGGNEKLPWPKVLVNNRLNRKENVPALRRAMIESGIEHVCSTCGLGSVWKDKRLVLQISHKNGDSYDNRKENVGFECPNCHSQTEDFGGRSAGKKNFGLVV